MQCNDIKMPCKIYEDIKAMTWRHWCCKIPRWRCRKVGLISLIQGYAIGNQLRGIWQEVQRIWQTPVKWFLRLRQLPWCQTLKISHAGRELLSLDLTQMMCSCTRACKHSYHGARPDQSVDGVFIDGDHSCPCQANMSRGLGLVPCLVPRFHDWQFGPFWHRYQAVVKDIDAWEPKARASWVKHHSWLMTCHDKLSIASRLNYFWMLLTFDLPICANLCRLCIHWLDQYGANGKAFLKSTPGQAGWLFKWSRLWEPSRRGAAKGCWGGQCKMM